MQETPKKVYKVILHSRGGKVIYVESIWRKRAVEAADYYQCRWPADGRGLK